LAVTLASALRNIAVPQPRSGALADHVLSESAASLGRHL